MFAIEIIIIVVFAHLCGENGAENQLPEPKEI